MKDQPIICPQIMLYSDGKLLPFVSKFNMLMDKKLSMATATAEIIDVSQGMDEMKVVKKLYIVIGLKENRIDLKEVQNFDWDWKDE